MDAPVLRSMAKTHKPPGDNGVPKSRLIVGASKGLTTPLGELLLDLIELVSRIEHDSNEAQSTEEILRKISEANERLRKEIVKDIALGSMDLVALYPSLDQTKSAEIVAEAIMGSDVVYCGVDYYMAGVYLANIWDKKG